MSTELTFDMNLYPHVSFRFVFNGKTFIVISFSGQYQCLPRDIYIDGVRLKDDAIVYHFESLIIIELYTIINKDNSIQLFFVEETFPDFKYINIPHHYPVQYNTDPYNKSNLKLDSEMLTLHIVRSGMIENPKFLFITDWLSTKSVHPVWYAS